MRLEPTPASLSAVARVLYHGDPSVSARLAPWRPYICPFELVLAHVPGGSALLDVGCGAGLLLALLAADGRLASGLGLDPSVRAIACARRMAQRLEPRRDVARANISFDVLPAGGVLPDRTFDVVTLVDVLHHVDPADQLALVRRAASRVAPGGRLIYKDMARHPAGCALANRAHDLLLSRDWIHYVPIDDVAASLAGAGFTIVARRNVRRFIYAHELLVAERRP